MGSSPACTKTCLLVPATHKNTWSWYRLGTCRESQWKLETISKPCIWGLAQHERQGHVSYFCLCIPNTKCSTSFRIPPFQTLVFFHFHSEEYSVCPEPPGVWDFNATSVGRWPQCAFLLKAAQTCMFAHIYVCAAKDQVCSFHRALSSFTSECPLFQESLFVN